MRQPIQCYPEKENEITEVPPIVHDVLRSSGQPLDEEIQTFMEQRFGHDFSRVRIYTDTKSAKSARALNALAYTSGQKVVFGSGQYAPMTGSGKRLLAHELAHVIQNQSALNDPTFCSSSLTERLEKEADIKAQTIISSNDAKVQIGLDRRKLNPILMKKTGSNLKEERKTKKTVPSKQNRVSLCDRDFAGALGFIVPARHCFVWFHSADTKVSPELIVQSNTSTYDNSTSSSPDLEPNKSGTVCRATYNIDPSCVKKKYLQLCDPEKYNLESFNCCTCAFRAIKECGGNLKPSDFPPENQGTGLPDSFGTGWKKETLESIKETIYGFEETKEKIRQKYSQVKEEFLEALEVVKDPLKFAKSLETRYPGWRNVLPNCPCTVDKARKSSEFQEDRWFVTLILNWGGYHPGAVDSFRTKKGYQSKPGTSHGQQCIYDGKGRLITDGPGAGTPDLWSPETNYDKHQKFDVNPFKLLGWEVYNRYWIPNDGGPLCQGIDYPLHSDKTRKIA